MAVIEASGDKPGPQQRSTEAVSLELGRTNLYRMEWEIAGSGMPYRGVAWSAGKGDFVGYGAYPPAKSKNREKAMSTAAMASQAQCVELAHLFFDETNSVARLAVAFARTNGPGVVTRINNSECYVLDGEFTAHDLIIWVDKGTFLIPQIQFVFGGKLDETALKTMPVPLAEKNQLKTWAKLKGTITETYEIPTTNKDMIASAYESNFPPSLSLNVQQGGQAPRVRREPRGTSPTSPTQLTRRVRQPNPNEPQQ
jgi:hypothetical protein